MKIDFDEEGQAREEAELLKTSTEIEPKEYGEIIKKYKCTGRFLINYVFIKYLLSDDGDIVVKHMTVENYKSFIKSEVVY